MAISIDWQNKIIFVPRNDMQLIQSTPTEIRRLDLNLFRLELKNLEDNLDGIVYPTTHSHNPPLEVGGVQLARSVEIINDYTVTFEDGQYAVNLVGANSNVGDRVNVNNVSVRSANSAGLVTSEPIEYASFEGAIWFKPSSPNAGTGFPIGSALAPVNNLSDAKLIADFRGIKKIKVLENATITGNFNFEEFSFEGLSHVNTQVIVDSSVNVINCSFSELNISGTLDGGSSLERCVVGDLDYVNGHIHNSSLYGTIYLNGNEDAYISNCTMLDVSRPPTVDMGGSGQDLVVTNWFGELIITNLNGLNQARIGLSAGRITIDATVSSGTITVTGVGEVTDNSTGSAVVDINSLVRGSILNIINLQTNTNSIANAVWNSQISNYQELGSTGEALDKASNMEQVNVF